MSQAFRNRLILLFLIGVLLGVGAFLVMEITHRPPPVDLPPADASKLQTGNCVQPCWYRIQPGETTLSEAELILRASQKFDVTRQDNQLCAQSSSAGNICLNADAQSQVVTDLYWNVGGETISLADALAAFGEPQSAKICGRTDTWHPVLNFANSVVVIGYGGSTLGGESVRFAANQQVAQVLYYAPGTVPAAYSQNTYPWPGYTEPPPDHSICMF